MITLTLKDQPPVPLEAEMISPDRTAGLTSEGIRALPVHLGKTLSRLDDFFTVEGEPGDQVLTPLRLPDGTALVVDRGWIPIDQGVPVTGEAAAPTGTVTVAGVLFPPDALTVPTGTASPVERITKVDLGQIGAQLPYPILPIYLLLQTQQPPQQGSLPEPPPLPPLTNGPHLSYAFQWFSFATIAIVGCIVLLRGDRRDEVAAVAPHRGEEI